MRVLSAGRLGAIVCLCALAVAIALSGGASPADAVVAKIGGHGYGITPMGGTNSAGVAGANRSASLGGAFQASGAGSFDELPQGGGQLVYHGGPVMHSNTTHVIYWDPSKEFSATTKAIVDGFFADVAHDSRLASNVFGVAAQYTDGTGNSSYDTTFGGSLADEAAYPSFGTCAAPTGLDEGPPYTKCLLDSQLQSQLTTFIEKEKLPTGASQLYFVLLPHKVVTCFDETPDEEIKFGKICSNNTFCAYHGAIKPGTAGETIYADIPFSLLDTTFAKACQFDRNNGIQQPNPDNGISETNEETRFADVALKYVSHEYVEAITDPLVETEPAWFDAHGEEIGDKCNATPEFKGETGRGIDEQAFVPTIGGNASSDNLFNQSIDGGSFYLQSQWDNGGKACLMKPLALSGAAFTSGTATAGSPVSFSGSSSDPYGGFDPSWTFGDGGTGTGASPTHTFATAGVYTVTMTPVDALTDSTGPSTSHSVTVAPPPAPTQPPASGSTTSTPAVVAAQTIAPNSAFTVTAGSFNAKTGVITLRATVADPGTFSWLATFANGKFGAFASANKCKAGFLRLAGRCRPAKIVYARASQSFASAGAVGITLKPGSSAARALKNALKKGKALLVSGTLSFQSSRGGSPVSRPFAIAVKLKK
jgi:hypothetical protein